MSNKPARQPNHCALHDLYYSEEGCWKCKLAELPGTPTSIEETLLNLGIDTNPDPEAVADPEPVSAPVATAQMPARRASILMAERKLSAAWDKFLQEAELNAPSAPAILSVCLDLAAFLFKKNKAYGDSALKPLRVISTADAAEQIRVRIDDKLSRLFRGQAGGEDALKDLVGYWVLLKVAEGRPKEGE